MSTLDAFERFSSLIYHAKLGALPFMVIAFAATAQVRAAEVELQIKLSDAESQDYKPAVLPSELLADPTAAPVFDQVKRSWVIKVRPLHSFLTRMTLALKGRDESVPRPPLSIALPYRDAVFEILITTSGNKIEQERVKSAYRGDLPAEDSTEWLNDFLAAANLISFLSLGSSAEDIPATAPLARALVVYAEAMEKLLTRTEWFGVPTDVPIRAEMIRTVIAAAESDKSLRKSINLQRVKHAFTLAKAAEHQLYSRIWKAIVDIPDFRCNEIFPVSRQFYDHLRRLPQEDYVEIRTLAQFTRSQVLLESVRCFRELLSIKPGARYALPQVVAGPFGGLPARQIAEELKGDLAREHEAVLRDSGRQPSGGLLCQSQTTMASRLERQLCDALAYMQELNSLLDEENGHAIN